MAGKMLSSLVPMSEYMDHKFPGDKAAYDKAIAESTWCVLALALAAGGGTSACLSSLWLAAPPAHCCFIACGALADLARCGLPACPSSRSCCAQ